MAEEKRQLKVFLCHARADKQKVRELYRYLLRRRIRPWFDEEHLVGGQDWQVEIPKALATSDAIIICLTKNSVDKEGYIQKEIKFALDKALEMPEGRIFLIPVKFEECEVPFSLSRYQWVDLTIESGYSKMMKALKFRALQLERATVELPKTPVADESKNVVLVKEQESIERAVRESAEREATEKTKQEKAERESAERTERERIAKEKIAREKAEQDAIVKSSSIPKRNLNLRKLIANVFTTFLVVMVVAGLIFSFGNPLIEKWLSPAPVVTESATATITMTSQPVVPSKTIEPGQTSSQGVTFTPTPLPTEITDAKGVSMVLVPAGEFTMGYSADVAYDFCITFSTKLVWYGSPCRKGDYLREGPVHKVYVNDFFVDVFEVSNNEYKKCDLEGACLQPSSNGANHYSRYYDNENFGDFPVLNVTWDMAKAYCEWRGARLPTEAEWEKAARGIDERSYPWGDFSSVHEVYKQVFYSNRANVNLSSVRPPVPVSSNSKGLSPYDLYNMAGNVAEWVADWYSETYYAVSPYENPSGPLDADYKVIRGGSMNTYEVRTTARDYRRQSAYDSGVGIRCAKGAP